MSMELSHILEKYQGTGRLTTLEKCTGVIGSRYRVKTVLIQNFGTEQSAREAFERSKSQLSNDLRGANGQGGNYTPKPTKRKKNDGETAKTKTQTKRGQT